MPFIDCISRSRCFDTAVPRIPNVVHDRSFPPCQDAEFFAEEDLLVHLIIVFPQNQINDSSICCCFVAVYDQYRGDHQYDPEYLQEI